MKKEEKELIKRLAKYATKHQDEHQDFIYIAYSLWQLCYNNLEGAKDILTSRGH